MICYDRWSVLAAPEQDKPDRHECDNGTRSTVSVLIYLLLLDGVESDVYRHHECRLGISIQPALL